MAVVLSIAFNTESISCFVEYNNFDFLVSGDMTGGGSTDTANTPDVETFVGQMVGDVDVLEFDHHGSTTANNRRFLKLLKADESTHIDELVELLEAEMSSSEIFAALFELELNGKVRQLPGRNFVKSF